MPRWLPAPISGSARRRSWRLALAVACAAVAGVAHAHEFWIDPVPALAPGAAIKTDLRVGQLFKGEPFPYISSRFNFFRVSLRGETFALPGFEGDLPAVGIESARAGLNVISFYGKPNLVTFDDPAVFATYLETEGLGWVAAAHKARGLPPVGFSESFTRTVKSLVQVGPALPEDKDVIVGMPFELVAGENPYALVGSRDLPVTLLWQGKPIPDTQVSIFQDRGEITRTVLRTDSQGRAVIKLDGGGRFLVSAVHMREAAPELNAAWESHWASLTFALPPG